jgi:hypothetical protein
MPKVYRQLYFGAKKELCANGTADKDENGQLVPRELTQEECEKLVAERQGSADGYAYTIEA